MSDRLKTGARGARKRPQGRGGRRAALAATALGLSLSLGIGAGAHAGAAPAGAVDAPAMDAAAFGAFAEGRTLVYRDHDGFAYGAEQHLGGRRVLWMDAQGRCEQGAWMARGPEMCFFYSADPLTPSCWTIRSSGGHVTATLNEAGEDFRLDVETSSAPLRCDADAGV